MATKYDSAIVDRPGSARGEEGSVLYVGYAFLPETPVVRVQVEPLDRALQFTRFYTTTLKTNWGDKIGVLVAVTSDGAKRDFATSLDVTRDFPSAKFLAVLGGDQVVHRDDQVPFVRALAELLVSVSAHGEARIVEPIGESKGDPVVRAELWAGNFDPSHRRTLMVHFSAEGLVEDVRLTTPSGEPLPEALY